MPQCLGDLDEKHITITNPEEGGLVNLYDKRFYFIALIALADVSYKFITIVIGREGSASTSVIFNASLQKGGIENDQLCSP